MWHKLATVFDFCRNKYWNSHACTELLVFFNVSPKIGYILPANYKVADQLMIVSGHYLFILSQKI